MLSARALLAALHDLDSTGFVAFADLGPALHFLHVLEAGELIAGEGTRGS